MSLPIVLFGQPLPMWLTLALTLGAVVLYVTEWLTLELTSLLILSVLLVLFTVAPVPLVGEEGVLDSARLLSGFGNPALITVLALLVVGEALIRTGALDRLAVMASHPRLGRLGSFVLVLTGVAALSAFLNNTPVVVIFIPILQSLANQLNLAGSQAMMPLSYAAILGGMTTVIGSSTNLLVSNTLTGLGAARLGFFEHTPLALILAVVGLAYVLLVLPRLLPKKPSLTGHMTHHGQQFISQIIIPEDSALVGQRAVAGHFRDLPNVTVRMIQRGEHAELPPFDDFMLQPGDILVLAAPRAALADVATRHPGHLHPPSRPGVDRTQDRLRRLEYFDDAAGSDKVGNGDGGGSEQILVEAMITPSSRIVGVSLEQYGFHQRYRCIAVGVLRRARMIRARMSDIRLESGDVLLIQGRPRDIDMLRAERDMVIMSGTWDVLPNKDKAGTSAAIFASAVGLAAFNIVPIVVAAVAAASLLLAVRAINFRQAVRALDRKVILVIASALALGEALYHTGGASYVAHGIVAALNGTGPHVILSVFFLMVALFTNILSNNACAVLFTPIGIGLSQELGIDPRLFAMTVLLAANCSFASPMGYQTNLLVMGPGQYSFSDFTKAGLPLLLLLWLVFSFAAPLVWGI